MEKEQPETDRKTFGMLRPQENKCQCCAVQHGIDQPHDKTSLFYQMYFNARNGRWPTWDDAMAHCSDDIKAQWRDQLALRGLWP